MEEGGSKEAASTAHGTQERFKARYTVHLSLRNPVYDELFSSALPCCPSSTEAFADGIHPLWINI